MRLYQLLILILYLTIATSVHVHGKPFIISVWSSKLSEKEIQVNTQIQILANQLQEVGYQVNYKQFDQTADIHIVVIPNEEDGKIVSYSYILNTSFDDSAISNVSPILSDQFNLISPNVEIILRISPTASLNHLLTIINLTKAHLEGDCDSVNDDTMLQELQENNDVIHSYVSFILGNCAILSDDYELAIPNFEQSLKYDFEHDSRYVDIAPATHLAWTYIQLGEVETAINIMNQTIEIPQIHSELTRIQLSQRALSRRASIHALAFDYDSAIIDMNAAIDLIDYDRFGAELYKQRGDIIMLIYEWNRALEDYSTALELDPDYAEAYYRRGILLYTMVEREDAITDFVRYLELDPEGQFAESATDYIASIQVELDALGG